MKLEGNKIHIFTKIHQILHLRIVGSHFSNISTQAQLLLSCAVDSQISDQLFDHVIVALDGSAGSSLLSLPCERTPA